MADQWIGGATTFHDPPHPPHPERGAVTSTRPEARAAAPLLHGCAPLLHRCRLCDQRAGVSQYDPAIEADNPDKPFTVMCEGGDQETPEMPTEAEAVAAWNRENDPDANWIEWFEFREEVTRWECEGCGRVSRGPYGLHTAECVMTRRWTCSGPEREKASIDRCRRLLVERSGDFEIYAGYDPFDVRVSIGKEFRGTTIAAAIRMAVAESETRYLNRGLRR